MNSMYIKNPMTQESAASTPKPKALPIASKAGGRRIQVRNFEVNVESGARLVEGPYVAETFAVSVEDEYLVVTM